MNSKILCNSILIFVFSILLNNYIFGQAYDVVVILKDGSTVKGELLELTPDSVAVIEEETGEYRVLHGSEISTVYIKGLNESIKYPISEVPDIFKKDKKEKSAVPYTPGAVYTPGVSYTPPTKSTKLSLGASYGGLTAILDEAIDGYKQTKWVGGMIISGSFLATFRGDYSVGFGIESINMDLEENGINFGTINLIPIMLLIQWYKIPYGTGFGTHAGFGIGMSINSFDTDALNTSFELFTGTSVNVETENSFVMDIRAGLDYFFSENISISIDGRLMFGSVSTTWNVSGYGNTVPVDGFDKFFVYNFQYLAGLRAWFN